MIAPRCKAWPSGLNATLVTLLAWTLRENGFSPVSLSQIFNVLSPLIETSR